MRRLRIARRGDRATTVYYGWLLVLVLALSEMTSWGVLYYAFSVFLGPMQHELGWSRAELTGAFSLALLLAGAAAFPTGRWLDLHGPRLLMTAGSCLAAVLVFAWARVNDLLSFYLIWAGIGLAMAAVLYEPAFAVIAVWFRQRRSLALTVLTFLAGLASVVFIPLAGWLIQMQGWRAALVSLAVVLALVTIPLHALVLRRRPEDLGLQPDGARGGNATNMQRAPDERAVPLARAVRGTAFRWMALAFGLNMLAAVAVTVHLVSYLTTAGYDPGFAASVAGMIGLMALPGRLVFTLLGEHLPRRLVTAFLFLLQTCGLLVLLLVPNIGGVVLFVILFGAGFGAITPARAAMVAELYGRTYYGRISSVLAMVLTLARAVAPVGAGMGVDLIGSYIPVFWTLAAVSAGATLVIPLVSEHKA